MTNFSLSNSMHRKNLSVATPSIIKSRAPSLNSSNREYQFHLSNPNPQPWTTEKSPF